VLRPSRSSSPSTALQDVKDKLKDYVSKNVAAKGEQDTLQSCLEAD
jgi:hypothetical protein